MLLSRRITTFPQRVSCLIYLYAGKLNIFTINWVKRQATSSVEARDHTKRRVVFHQAWWAAARSGS